MKGAPPEDAEFTVEDLLVRQVKGLVSATADMIVRSLEGDCDAANALKTAAHLYRVLAANCQVAGELAESFADPEPKTPKKKGRKR